MLSNRAMRRTILLACLSLGAGPATAPADRESELQATLDAANARIMALEAQVAELQSQLGGATARAEKADARAEKSDTAAAAALAQTARIKDNGSVKAFKRIVNDHIRAGMSTADVKGILGEPKETRGEAGGTVYVYKRADLGQRVHGAFTPGPKYTYELTFDPAGKLQTIRGEAR
jgi:hypothetical protein